MPPAAPPSRGAAGGHVAVDVRTHADWRASLVDVTMVAADVGGGPRLNYSYVDSGDESDDEMPLMRTPPDSDSSGDEPDDGSPLLRPQFETPPPRPRGSRADTDGVIPVRVEPLLTTDERAVHGVSYRQVHAPATVDSGEVQSSTLRAGVCVLSSACDATYSASSSTDGCLKRMPSGKEMPKAERIDDSSTAT